MQLFTRDKLSLISHILCIAGTLRFVIHSCMNYERDSDAYELTYQKFHKESFNIYPALSMCFTSLINEEALQTYAKSVDSTMYEKYLSGMHDAMKMLANVSYNDVSYHADDYILAATVEGRSKTSTDNTSHTKNIVLTNITTFSWINNHRLVVKCFAFQLPTIKDVIYDRVQVNVRNGIFPNGIRPVEGWKSKGMQIYLHYPQQFLSSYSTRKLLCPIRKTNVTYKIVTYVSAIEVIRHRQKSNQMCYEGTSYDGWVLEHIMAMAGCRPPYWTSSKWTTCQSKVKISNAGGMFWDYLYGNEELDPPCREIKSMNTDYMDWEEDEPNQNTSQFHFMLVFRDSVYKGTIQQLYSIHSD